MNPVIAVTALGPLLGATSWLFGLTWVFWIGVVVCALTLAMDMQSGAMKLPVLPVALMAIASGIWSPWWFGAAIGLMAWTTFDAVGMMVNRLRLAGRGPGP